MKLSILGSKFAVAVTGVLLMLVARPAGNAAGSLSDLDIEYAELKVTLEKVLGENRQLRSTLAETEKSLAEMRKSLAATSGEAEVFKRQAMEMKLRIDALGTGGAGAGGVKLEQRLLAAVNDLRVMTDEKRKLSEALIRLTEATSLFARTSTGANPDSRLALEAELRNAKSVLGAGSPAAVEAEAVPSSVTSGMAISVKEDLALVVMNLGEKQGVKVGMPFQVLRGEKLIGSVRVVDVREKIAGALIQNLSSEKDHIQVGDHLKVDARQ
jgi:hypothetical protein